MPVVRSVHGKVTTFNESTNSVMDYYKFEVTAQGTVIKRSEILSTRFLS